MSFPRGPGRGVVPIRTPVAVWGVGRRVSVADTDGFRTRVALTDEAGGAVLGDLVAGAEVEILGWRPSGSRGVRYQVRATQGGLEGWLGVASLRDPKAVVAPAAGSDRQRAADPRDIGRRFGAR